MFIGLLAIIVHAATRFIYYRDFFQMTCFRMFEKWDL